MNKIYVFAIIFLSLICTSCKKENSTQIYNLSGLVQKGPYKTGSDVDILELSETLQPTGKVYQSTVSDNMGSFSIPNVELESNYIELKAEGYYFNEYVGYDENLGKLVLKAVANVQDDATMNVNILSHISVERIKYLVQNENLSFDDALNQTQNEILSVFNLQEGLNSNYTDMDISQPGSENAKLLAVNSIIFSNKSPIDLTEFLNEFSFDLRDNGVIDSESIQNTLATSAVLCNTGGIRKNLSLFYNNDSVFNEFQQYVQHFLDNTSYTPEVTSETLFPSSDINGVNLLSLPDLSTLDTTENYCITISPELFEIVSYISIGKVKNPDNVDIELLETDGWDYDLNYPLSQWNYPSCLIKGWPNNLSENKTPLKINLHGNGELIIRVYLSSESLASSNPDFVIDKYLKW